MGPGHCGNMQFEQKQLWASPSRAQKTLSSLLVVDIAMRYLTMVIRSRGFLMLSPTELMH